MAASEVAQLLAGFGQQLDESLRLGGQVGPGSFASGQLLAEGRVVLQQLIESSVEAVDLRAQLAQLGEDRVALVRRWRGHGAEYSLACRVILVLAPFVPHPPKHGGSIRSRVLLDALTQDHEVHLAAPVADDEARQNAADLVAATGITFHELPGNAVVAPSLIRKGGQWLRGRSELFVRRWDPTAAGVARELVESLRPELLVADSSFVLPLLPPSGRAGGDVPLLLYLHNLEFALFARPDAQARAFSERMTRRFEAKGMAREEARALRRAVQTVVVSDRDAELARGLAPEARLEVIPNSVDLERLPRQPRKTAGPPRLLFVGGLDYPPNREAVAELLERHLPRLHGHHPGLLVRHIGKDDAGLGRRHPERDGLEVMGFVDDLLPHYAASDAAFLPIRSGGGTRIKVLEAWALGLPVIATGVATEGLEGEDGVHFLRFENVSEGEAALGRVLAGGDEIAAMTDRARRLVEERYSHAAVTARLRAVVAEVFGRLRGK